MVDQESGYYLFYSRILTSAQPEVWTKQKKKVINISHLYSSFINLAFCNCSVQESQCDCSIRIFQFWQLYMNFQGCIDQNLSRIHHCDVPSSQLHQQKYLHWDFTKACLCTHSFFSTLKVTICSMRAHHGDCRDAFHAHCSLFEVLDNQCLKWLETKSNDTFTFTDRQSVAVLYTDFGNFTI